MEFCHLVKVERDREKKKEDDIYINYNKHTN